MSTENHIPPDRLMEAVDAIFFALEEMGRRAFKDWPSRLLGSPDQPIVFCNFTQHEIHEAEQFLARCGLLRCASGGHG